MLPPPRQQLRALCRFSASQGNHDSCLCFHNDRGRCKPLRALAELCGWQNTGGGTREAPWEGVSVQCGSWAVCGQSGWRMGPAAAVQTPVWTPEGSIVDTSHHSRVGLCVGTTEDQLVIPGDPILHLHQPAQAASSAPCLGK